MNKEYITSESVTEGHPDKVCDLIADTLLDEYLMQDPLSKVAIEVFVFKDTIIIAGQVTSKGIINIDKITRNVIKEIGYDNDKIDFDYKTCKIITKITKQSQDIEMGIANGGAGDQGIMFGYATDETEELMPYGSLLANALAKKLAYVRKKKILSYLRPDGKVQVTIEYENNKPIRIDTIIISCEHLENISQNVIREDIIEKVIETVIDKKMLDKKTKILINPAGKFTIGGPLADTGLTGRKIIADTYGGYAHNGGGALSGKDASKVDRSAQYMLRFIAKNIVANKYAKKCEIQISYAIGVKEPISLNINTFGTGKYSDEYLINLINEKFDLTPEGMIKYLNLKKPIYKSTTNYGHFGKKDLLWEQIIKI